jgi:hypothetical protein
MLGAVLLLQLTLWVATIHAFFPWISCEVDNTCSKSSKRGVDGPSQSHRRAPERSGPVTLDLWQRAPNARIPSITSWELICKHFGCPSPARIWTAASPESPAQRADSLESMRHWKCYGEVLATSRFSEERISIPLSPHSEPPHRRVRVCTRMRPTSRTSSRPSSVRLANRYIC